jgi:UDP-2,3-diacylglucosamine hydrolase
LEKNKKIYFASDVHLGLPNYEDSLVREKKIVKWLDEIKNDAAEIYFLGDVFDFWWDWKYVVPRGFTRFLGKVAEISDSGIPVHFFTGNHDVWHFDYLEQELGAQVYRQPIEREFDGKRFYIGHGDGLGPGDYSFKLLKKAFTSRFLQWCFARLHPNFAIWLAYGWSRSSRKMEKPARFFGLDKEWLIVYSREILKQKHFDYFVFGHRHMPMILEIAENTKYVNTGDWLANFTYVEWNGNEMELKRYEG